MSFFFILIPQSYGDLLKLEKNAGLCAADPSTQDSKLLCKAGTYLIHCSFLTATQRLLSYAGIIEHALR